MRNIDSDFTRFDKFPRCYTKLLLETLVKVGQAAEANAVSNLRTLVLFALNNCAERFVECFSQTDSVFDLSVPCKKFYQLQSMHRFARHFPTNAKGHALEFVSIKGEDIRI